MDIIEKETVKEVPVDCNGNRVCGGWGYGYGNHYPYNNVGNFASKGVAGTGLGLGIAGTALGLLALSRAGGFNLFGGNSNVPQNVNINTDSSYSGGYGVANGICAPTTFQVWEKGCEDALALQSAIYKQALDYQNNRFADRQTLNTELFGVYKSQIDADFGLYKSTRDGFDALSAKQNRDAFGLYKSQRDADDEIRKEISDLKAQVAINAAVRPYQDKLIQCEIDKAFTAGINYTDRKTCKAIYGQVTLPNTPVITGYAGANTCGCPQVITTT
jgi:hypothetical protein